MAEKTGNWGPRLPADPERAERNRAAVRALVRKHEPGLAFILGGVVRELAPEKKSRAARSR